MEPTELTPDQQMSVLNWLENLYYAGMTLKEVIEGLQDGTLSASVSESK